MSCSRYCSCYQSPCIISPKVPNTYQRYDDFAIRMCMKVVRLLQVLPQYSVVIDLAIDRQRYRLFIVD